MMKNKSIFRESKNMKGDKFKRLKSNYGFGVNEIIGLAAGLIIAAVVVIPGLRTLAQSVMNELTTWWDSVAITLFV